MTNRDRCEIEAREIVFLPDGTIRNCFLLGGTKEFTQELIDTITEALLKLRDENEKLKDELLRQLKNKEELQEKLRVARWALNKLSRLGNEPNLGNSTGNMIAREAIQQIGEV